jgi:hypothetical protein
MPLRCCPLPHQSKLLPHTSLILIKKENIKSEWEKGKEWIPSWSWGYFCQWKLILFSVEFISKNSDHPPIFPMAFFQKSPWKIMRTKEGGADCLGGSSRWCERVKTEGKWEERRGGKGKSNLDWGWIIGWLFGHGTSFLGIWWNWTRWVFFSPIRFFNPCRYQQQERQVSGRMNERIWMKIKWRW